MKNVSLIELQDKFLQRLETQGKSFNTIKNYKTDLNIYNQFLSSRGRKLLAQEMSDEHVHEYNAFLNSKYKSPNSIRRRIQALRLFCDFLIENQVLDSNPIKKLAVAPKVVDIPRPVSLLTIIKFKDSLLNKIEISTGHEKLLNYRNLMLFYLIYGAGLKVSDIERLKSDHILDGKRILIAHEKRDPYTVPLPEQFIDLYLEYSTLILEAKRRDNIEFDDFLFNGNPFKVLSGRLSARGIEVIFKDYSKKFDEVITAKNLRQACILKWISASHPASSVKEWMGVQPQYSLTPYKKLIKEEPEKFTYMDI